MSINIKRIETLTGNIFEIDDEGNVALVGNPIFEDDPNGDLMPTINGTQDIFFEIDGDNNITSQL